MTAPRPGVSWLRLLVIAGLLSFTAVTVIRSVAPARAALRRTEAMVEAQEAENQGLRAAAERGTREADALRTDPWVVKRILRDEYRITEDGEILVR